MIPNFGVDKEGKNRLPIITGFSSEYIKQGPD